MNKSINNEELINDSNQPHSSEFYNELSNGKVFNLIEIIEYDWVKNSLSDGNKVKRITNDGEFVIWKFGDVGETVDTLFSSSEIEQKINSYELNGTEQNEYLESIIDDVVDEFNEELESHFPQEKVRLISDIDDFSNYYVGIEGNLSCDGYDEYTWKVRLDFNDRIEYMVKTIKK